MADSAGARPAQEEGEGEEEEPATPAHEALKYDANGAVKKAALRSENEAQRAADLDRRAPAPPAGLGFWVCTPRRNEGLGAADPAAHPHGPAAWQLHAVAASEGRPQSNARRARQRSARPRPILVGVNPSR